MKRVTMGEIVEMVIEIREARLAYYEAIAYMNKES